MHALLAAWIGLTVAAAAPPTVAVMPFKNLSGVGAPVGEAIRETVTSDLKGVSELRVLERGNVDKVLREEHLEQAQTDLDAVSTVRVGKLLGATMIVIGAYQQAGSDVRLTARFVRVETGEIVGTAKVDGVAGDFLKLQDRVTVELLHSLGVSPRSVRHFQGRPRPSLRSLRPLELYEKAVVEKDDTKRRKLLQDAVQEEPTFEYAVRDLNALEERLQGYDAAAKKAEAHVVDERRAAIAKASPAELGPLEMQLLGELSKLHRYHELEREARAVMAHPESHGGSTAAENAASQLLQAEWILKEWDALLHDGEAFLKRSPGSVYFKTVEGFMTRVIAEKRSVEEGKAKLEEGVGVLGSQARWDLCLVANIYERHAQYPEARRLLRACQSLDPDRPGRLGVQLVRLDIACADWPQARQDAAQLEKDDPVGFRANRAGFEFGIPADD